MKIYRLLGALILIYPVLSHGMITNQDMNSGTPTQDQTFYTTEFYTTEELNNIKRFQHECHLLMKDNQHAADSIKNFLDSGDDRRRLFKFAIVYYFWWKTIDLADNLIIRHSFKYVHEYMKQTGNSLLFLEKKVQMTAAKKRLDHVCFNQRMLFYPVYGYFHDNLSMLSHKIVPEIKKFLRLDIFPNQLLSQISENLSNLPFESAYEINKSSETNEPINELQTLASQYITEKLLGEFLNFLTLLFSQDWSISPDSNTSLQQIMEDIEGPLPYWNPNCIHKTIDVISAKFCQSGKTWLDMLKAITNMPPYEDTSLIIINNPSNYHLDYTEDEINKIEAIFRECRSLTEKNIHAFRKACEFMESGDDIDNTLARAIICCLWEITTKATNLLLENHNKSFVNNIPSLWQIAIRLKQPMPSELFTLFPNQITSRIREILKLEDLFPDQVLNQISENLNNLPFKFKESSHADESINYLQEIASQYITEKIFEIALNFLTLHFKSDSNTLLAQIMKGFKGLLQDSDPDRIQQEAIRSIIGTCHRDYFKWANMLMIPVTNVQRRSLEDNKGSVVDDKDSVVALPPSEASNDPFRGLQWPPMSLDK